MKKLMQLHDKVKYHRYREDIVLNSRYYKGYVEAFQDLLDGFQKEIDAAREIPSSGRSLSARMLIELEHRCFLIEARRKLNTLLFYAQSYQKSGQDSDKRYVQILMMQLESALSTIHEYLAYSTVRFFLRYPEDDSMEKIRFIWQGTDYISESLSSI